MIKLIGSYDLAIIGGGIIGLATARQFLLSHPKLRVCVLEKEFELADHQSRRNSGVVHRGVYYKKGSLKSKFCIKGAQLVEEYCKKKNVPYQEVGKLIVATKTKELEVLHRLHDNATANKIEPIELLTRDQIQKIQPGCTKALEAIWSPKTAIVDWQKIAQSYAEDFRLAGGHIFTRFGAGQLISLSDSIVIEHVVDKTQVRASYVVNCAGLLSDVFCRITGNSEHPKVVPFKGRYYQLSDRLAASIKTNIYPVPDPDLPFLGVHITPRVDGSVIVGPTALLALGYERYDSYDPVRLNELNHILVRSGFREMIKKKENFKAGLKELWRFISKDKFTEEVKELFPELKDDDLIDTGFCGIRAQTIQKNGELVDDFLFETGLKPEFNRVLHVRNCPSPAATSSLAIAERIASTIEDRLV